MQEKISVIVPVYKAEKYLNRGIESIVCQTYTNIEIILVDDSSPDRCPEMCDEWAEKDNPDFSRLYDKYCVFFGKSLYRKAIIKAKRIIKRILNK